MKENINFILNFNCIPLELKKMGKKNKKMENKRKKMQ